MLAAFGVELPEIPDLGVDTANLDAEVTVKINGVAPPWKVKSFAITTSTDKIEVTTFGDNTPVYVNGLNRRRFKITATIDPDELQDFAATYRSADNLLSFDETFNHTRIRAQLRVLTCSFIVNVDQESQIEMDCESVGEIDVEAVGDPLPEVEAVSGRRGMNLG